MEHTPVTNAALRQKLERLRDQLEKLWSLPEEELRRRGMSDAAIQNILTRQKGRLKGGNETP
jgi:hypothetical protein